MNNQEKQWSGNFGDKYTIRNFDNVKIDYKEFLSGFNRSIKILEVGSNVGNQLISLKKFGFKNLYGIEINPRTVDKSKIKNIIVGSAFDIPFKDNYFDLVFTAGLLIHISPKDILRVMREIIRCSNKYVLGTEYFADDYTKILYRGNKNLLWKADFAKIYQEFNLKLVKEKMFENEGNTDTMFLLKKGK